MERITEDDPPVQSNGDEEAKVPHSPHSGEGAEAGIQFENKMK